MDSSRCFQLISLVQATPELWETEQSVEFTLENQELWESIGQKITPHITGVFASVTFTRLAAHFMVLHSLQKKLERTEGALAKSPQWEFYESLMFLSVYNPPERDIQDVDTLSANSCF